MSTTTRPTESKVGETGSAYSLEAIRAEFPALKREANGHPLTYLDSAATSLKPRCVIDAVSDFYSRYCANVHRGVHTMSQEATLAFEGARDRIRRYVNAADTREIIFTRGATEAVNLVAHSWGRSNLREGDEILLSGMEHHSNIVPWQIAAEQTGAVIRVVPVTDAGEFDFEAFENLLSERTKIVGCVHVSNALGTINPVREITEQAHKVGAKVIIDGAQALPHQRVDVRGIGCDFYAASGHKMFGPMGIGFLYGRYDLLDAMPPYQGGGDMIKSVTFEKTTYNDLPNKFEAGTPNVGGAIGLGAAVDFLERVDLEQVARHEAELLEYGTELLKPIESLRLIGTAPRKAGVLSFTIDGIHPHDIGTILDQFGVAIRTGHHCTQPLMERFGVAATARASLALYNSRSDLDALARGLDEVMKVFA